MTVEWLDGEDDADELPQPAPVGPGRRRAIWIGLIAVIVAVAVAVAVDETGGGKKRQAAGTGPSTRPSTSASISTPPPSTSASPLPTASSPTVLEVGHRVLGATSNWELFAHGSGTLIRIEMAAGVVHRTPTPALDSNGGLSFVVGPTSAILRPFDSVSGYVIADGQAPRVLRGLLAQGGSIYPGPTSDKVWIEPPTTDVNTPAPRLYDLRTQRAVETAPSAPQSLGQPFMADGSGYLLYSGVGGVYDVLPDGVHRVTTGTVAAADAHSWLAQECDDAYRCTMLLIDKQSGARTTLGRSSGNISYLPGSISPDGRYAVFSTVVGGDLPTTHLLDLKTGRDTDLHLVPSDSGYGGTPFVWDPDNDDLLLVDQTANVQVVDPVTHKVGSLGVDLPPIDQIAIRPSTH